jgi:sterol desaturase/sphingolipid hydroxylase (fatty acid hydroxylase superfamily)
MCSSTPAVVHHDCDDDPATTTSATPPPLPRHRADDEDANVKNNKEQQEKELQNHPRTHHSTPLPTSSSVLPDLVNHTAPDIIRVDAVDAVTTTRIIAPTTDSDLGGSSILNQVHSSSVKNHPHENNKDSTIYTWEEPPQQENKLHFHEHFSSLLLRGSVQNTVLEFALLLLPFVFLAIFDCDNKEDDHGLNVKGSMPLRQVAIGLVVCSIIRRIYNAYLEAVYFSFSSLRTQPPKDHQLAGHRNKRDLMGRDKEQLEILESHDKWTLVSQFLLTFGLYYALPGFYPTATSTDSMNSHDSPLNLLLLLLLQRFPRLVLNHYVLSFGMYWAHRSLHVIPWLWDNIHSLHHYAKHPLSRNTYEDHWLDNLLNSILGHVYAQILVPLDGPTFWFSRIFRILESLEKHSGVSCGFNLAHSVQQWLPFAQMPHHHDWHHEGYKGSNYTFSSLGGLWDCIFGTRKGGRFRANNFAAATREDVIGTNISSRGGAGNSFTANKKQGGGGFFTNPLWPLVGVTLLVGMKLKTGM